MYWNAHGDFLHHKILPNIAHYLGIGTELSSVALRHQIAGTVWVSSERFPVLDMRWIAGQYYNLICNYTGNPQSQEALAEVFRVDANLWNLGVNDNAFLTVEDEFNNLFEMTKLFSTRAKNQMFLNVISENYLLRDYMVDNASVFTADSKIIPSIVPDYTRTERNTVVSLIMRMLDGCVSENELKQNLSITGIGFTDPHKKFCELVSKHCHVDVVDIAVNYKDEITGDEMLAVKTPYYAIHNNDTKFADYARNFSNAYFIIEDDKDKMYRIGAMLYGQVFQKYLPGQMLTYSGKYYQVQTITPGSGVVLRRAADHITDRKSYRQRRGYSLSGFSPDPAMGSCRTSRGVELRRGFCDISVRTRGYYELTSLDNLAAAHQVDLNGIPERAYKNKAVLCLKLPGVSEEARFTVALLLNEIFITIYPENYHYITATVKKKSDTGAGITKLLSPIQLCGFDDDESIYIIEDCEIDLGLLVSIERNIIRLLEIIADYLSWYMADQKKPEASDKDEGESQAGTVPEPAIRQEDEGEPGIVSETVIEQEDEGEADTVPEPAIGQEDEGETDIILKPAVAQTVPEKTDPPSESPAEQAGISSESDGSYPAEKVETEISVFDIPTPIPPKKYSESQYLLYGYERLDPMLNIHETLRFLSTHCYDKNALKQARANSNIAARIEAEIDFGKPDAHFCDFCAVELAGGEYDVLSDGRERCTQCANSAMKTVGQFTRLYENALRNMETFFGIRINVAIKVRMANAKKIAKLCGEKFVPTPGFDGRTLAFAKKDSDCYTIYVENGAPKIAAVANIVHELTHIWQYINWNRMKIRSRYGRENELLVYEGMAKWTEIQYLLFLNEVSYAKRQEIYTRARDDAYGRGFIKYTGQYPLVYGPGYRKTSPFNKEWPLETASG
jgi:hypothetical protein